MSENPAPVPSSPSSATRAAFWLAGTVLMGHTTIASAQTQMIEPGPLPGTYTELQRPVADGIFRVCANLTRGLNVVPSSSGTPTQRLAYSCSVMVNTARATGSDVYDLKLTSTQLATAVQAIAPVQANAQKQISTEAVKMNTIGARMLNLRGGARGMMLGMNDQHFLHGAKGGAASADDVLGGKLGSFVNVTYNWGKLDKTTLQDAYKQDSYNLVGGIDYRISDAFVAGAALSYSDAHSKYEMGLGSVKAKTTGAVGYATYYSEQWYIDGLIGYGSADFESRRNISIPSNNVNVPSINTVAASSPEGDQWSAALGAGKDFRSASMTLTPSVRLSYLQVKNKAFSETEPVAGLGLSVGARTLESLQSSCGAKVSTTMHTSLAVLLPYLSVQWMHEFKKGTPALISRYVNDPNGIAFAIPTSELDRDYGMLAIGGSATFPNQLSAFAQVSSALGLKNENSYAVAAGLRLQF